VDQVFTRKGHEPVHTLDHITFQVADEEQGEFIALVGPSGSGKSTMLNLMGGLYLPTTGEVYTAGELVTGPNKNTVTVQQSYTCYPWLTIQQNVMFGLDIQGKNDKEKKALSMEYLDKVGLADRGSAYPKELSGGMQQRVAIARALAVKPPIVLMDEPFGALDAQTRATMQEMLVNLWSIEKSMIVFVTHDISEAILLADRIIVLSARPAKIVYDIRVPFGRPRTQEIFRTPDYLDLSKEIMERLKNHTQS